MGREGPKGGAGPLWTRLGVIRRKLVPSLTQGAQTSLLALVRFRGGESQLLETHHKKYFAFFSVIYISHIHHETPTRHVLENTNFSRPVVRLRKGRALRMLHGRGNACSQAARNFVDMAYAATAQRLCSFLYAEPGGPRGEKSESQTLQSIRLALLIGTNQLHWSINREGSGCHDPFLPDVLQIDKLRNF